MQCPKCHQPAITFLEWGQQKKAFRHICQNCGEPLKGDRVTIFWFITAICSMIAFAGGFAYFDRNSPHTILLLAGLMVIGLVITLIAWKRGGYVSTSPDAPRVPWVAARTSDPATESDYTAVAWRETHRCRLSDHRLDYEFESLKTSVSLDLKPGGYTLRPRWMWHRNLPVGLILFAFAVFSLGSTYLQERTFVQLGWVLYLELGMLVFGAILVVRFYALYRTYVLRKGNSVALLIYRDPRNAEGAENFIARLGATISAKFDPGERI